MDVYDMPDTHGLKLAPRKLQDFALDLCLQPAFSNPACRSPGWVKAAWRWLLSCAAGRPVLPIGCMLLLTAVQPSPAAVLTIAAVIASVAMAATPFKVVTAAVMSGTLWVLHAL